MVKGTALVFLQLSNDILEKKKDLNLNKNKSALAAFVTAAGKQKQVYKLYSHCLDAVA